MPVGTTVPVQRAGEDLSERAATGGDPESSRRAGFENEVILLAVSHFSRFKKVNTNPGSLDWCHGPDALTTSNNL